MPGRDNKNNDDDYIDLHAYLKVLYKWRYLIIFGTLTVLLVSSILYYYVVPSIYEAQAILQVNQMPDKKEIDQAQNSDQTIDKNFDRIINTYLFQVKSDAVMNDVVNKLKLKITPSMLGSMINVTNPDNSNLILIKVQNKDPKLATNLANAVSYEFINSVLNKNKEQTNYMVALLKGQRQELVNELNKIHGSQVSADEKNAEIGRLNAIIDSLDRKVVQVQTNEMFGQNSSIVIMYSKANVPVSPIKPNKKKNIIIDTFLSFVVFITAAFLLEYLNNVYRNN